MDPFLTVSTPALCTFKTFVVLQNQIIADTIGTEIWNYGSCHGKFD